MLLVLSLFLISALAQVSPYVGGVVPPASIRTTGVFNLAACFTINAPAFATALGFWSPNDNLVNVQVGLFRMPSVGAASPYDPANPGTAVVLPGGGTFRTLTCTSPRLALLPQDIFLSTTTIIKV